MTEIEWDVAVLGAGAAGLMAAIAAAEAGARVVLLEKNRRPGVKILVSGGTRCNLANARGLRRLDGLSGPIDPAYDPKLGEGNRAIQRAFGPGGPFLGPSLRAFDTTATIAMFEAEGLATKVEGNGKIFPVSDRATDVLAALLARLGRSGAELRGESPVTGLARSDQGFEIATPSGPLLARSVVLAVGGQSYPGCGTTGDGYAIARSLGHTIVEPRPALVPLRVGADWVPTLRGLTVPDAVATVVDAEGRKLDERREAVLFAHFGLTGPAILDVSREVARRATEGDRAGRLGLRIDFDPDRRPEAIDQQMQKQSREGRPSVPALLPASLPRRLAEAIATAAAIPAGRVGPELSRDERRRLIGALKSLELPITGTLGFAKAEVTSGGVALDEVDPATLESRRCPGLFLAGEVLDLDGRIGGYNFQAAWSTGWLAGRSACAALPRAPGLS